MGSSLDTLLSTTPHDPNKLGSNLGVTQGPRINATMITLIILTTGFTIGRLLSRWLARAGFWVRILALSSCQ